jgi:hypothetical protein
MTRDIELLSESVINIHNLAAYPNNFPNQIFYLQKTLLSHLGQRLSSDYGKSVQQNIIFMHITKFRKIWHKIRYGTLSLAWKIEKCSKVFKDDIAYFSTGFLFTVLVDAKLLLAERASI